MLNKKITTFIFCMLLTAGSLQAQMFWNQAARFDGTSYIACPNSLAMNIVGSVTMEAWVYPTTSTGVRYIIFKGNAGQGYYLRINSNGTLTMGTNGLNRVTSASTVPAGKWTHVAASYNVTNDAFRIYINSVPEGSSLFNNPPVSNTDSLFIGKFGANTFTGLIDEVRIWTKEVPQTDIRKNMRTSLALASGKYTSLLFSLPFQRVNNAGTNFSIQELSFNPVGTTPTYNRGVTAANFANAPSDYLYSNDALEFDGDYDSYAAIPSNGLNNLNGAMTLEAWINVDGASAVTQYIFHKYIGGLGYRMLVTNSMKLGVLINGSSYESSQTLFTSRWYHVAWVISASGATSLYINGVLDSYIAATGFPTAHNDSLYIGRGFKGYIDEVRMFKYERTADDIKKFIDMPMEQSNMPAGESFVFNLDGTAWANGGIQFFYLRGNAGFTAPAALQRTTSPLVRAEGYSFQEGFYKVRHYRRIPEGNSTGDMLDDSIFIPDNVTINDINVHLALNHGNIPELEIKIVSPSGTEFLLMNNIGLLGTSTSVATIFDDQADSTLADDKFIHISPRIKPQSSINFVFQGQNAAGVWKLKIRDMAGVSGGSLSSWGIQINNSPVIGIQNISGEVPEKFSLGQNYPNPFNPMTNIGLRIADFGFVSLKVFDITGKEVAVLVNEELNAGVYNVDFDASHLSSGTYFYRMETAGFSDVKKMIVIK